MREISSAATGSISPDDASLDVSAELDVVLLVAVVLELDDDWAGFDVALALVEPVAVAVPVPAVVLEQAARTSPARPATAARTIFTSSPRGSVDGTRFSARMAW